MRLLPQHLRAMSMDEALGLCFIAKGNFRVWPTVNAQVTQHVVLWLPQPEGLLRLGRNSRVPARTREEEGDRKALSVGLHCFLNFLSFAGTSRQSTLCPVLLHPHLHTSQ